MAWIRMIKEENAQGELAELYDQALESWGGVDNILKIHSLNPASLRGHFELYKTLMRGPSDLSLVQREMIAVVVSAVNHCHY
jgi:alkylhydroperoxidase family enzyme